jgi:hypothetical protein
MTEWKPIWGYEGMYEVSNKGEVRSLDRIDSAGRKLRGVTLRQHVSPNGYSMVSLCEAGKRAQKTVHKLVAEAFHGWSKKWVNHINGVKTDNRAENLEWLTPGENLSHAWDNGLRV